MVATTAVAYSTATSLSSKGKVMKKITTEDFKTRASKKHDSFYNYDKSIYTGGKKNLTITCPVHGDFKQQAGNHMSGKGCDLCGRERNSGYRTGTLENFKEVSTKEHDGFYDYSESMYVGSKLQLKIGCPLHGIFLQSPEVHMKGSGCPKCGHEKSGKNRILTTEQFIENCKNKGYIDDYDKVVYTSAFSEVTITCPAHGDFQIVATKYISGTGCPVCGDIRRGRNTISTPEFIRQAKIKQGTTYTYPNAVYVANDEKLIITCKKHGDFEQTPKSHLRGKGCAICNESTGERKIANILNENEIRFVREKKFDSCINVKQLPFDFFLPEKQILIEYQGIQHYKTVKTDFFGGEEALIERQKRDQIKRDWTANSPYKLIEISYLDDISQKLFFLDWSHNSIIDGLSFDYVSANVAVDILPLTSDNTRQKKQDAAEKMGIHLVSIFQDTWENKTDIVKSRINNLLGNTPTRIFARKTVVKEVSAAESRNFLNENHIQGFVGSNVKLGLYYQDELVALMTFSGYRKNMGRTAKENCFELSRFCSKLNTNVIGGANKLFSAFLKREPKEIISYADRFWSQGKLYENLGFERIRKTQPNYYYTLGEERENRYKYRKAELVADGYDKEKTEYQIMEERGYSRVYDAGSILYTYTHR